MPTTNTNLKDIGLLFLRVLGGLGIAYHGYGKIFGGRMEGFTSGVASMGFPLPEFFAWAAALSEFAGGILIALGLFFGPAAFCLFMTMAVAAFIKHGDDPFKKKELALAYWTIFGTLLLIGPGKYSLDHLIQKKKSDAKS